MFGSDGSPILQYVVIFAVIFTALAAIVFVVRRLTGRSLALPGRAGGRGRQPRLGIVDVYELDRARQLILLRRDNVEHLLLVGGPNDVVIERNIQRGQRALPEAGLRPEPMAEPLPDPLAGAGRLPEPPLALPEIAGSEIAGSGIGGRRSGPLFDPGFAMPVVVPAPVPGSAAAPPVTLPLDAVLLGGDEPGQDIAVPARPAGPGARVPAPPPTQPVTRPSGQAAAPVRESFSARLLRRTAPPILDPRPEPASERRPGAAPAKDVAPAQDAVPQYAAAQDAAPTQDGAPARAEPAPPQAAAPVPPLAVSAERRAVDPAILSDMARQLQAALARPSSAVTPAPAPPPPPEPAAPTPAVDAVAAAMAAPEPAPDAAPQRPEPPAGPVEARGPAPQEMTPGKPAPPRPAPIPPTLPRETDPIPAPEAVRPPPHDAPPTPPPPEPAAKNAGNPFSVEEIEAEFARLLGRPLDKRG